MSWISIAIGSIAIVALVFYLGRTARRVWLAVSWGLRQYRLVPIDDVSGHLQRLLENGHDGGFVVIQDPATREGFATKLVHLVLLEIFRLPRDCRVRITLETRG